VDVPGKKAAFIDFIGIASTIWNRFLVWEACVIWGGQTTCWLVNWDHRIEEWDGRSM